MSKTIDRRQFIKLASYGGGVVFASALGGIGKAHAVFGASDGEAFNEDFYFVQMSDTHWGFQGPLINPDARGTLPKAVAEVNALVNPPDFIVFTGDLTQTTDDPVERRKRLAEFREIVGQLRVKRLYFMPGEHDAALDHGKAYSELFGPTHWSFDYRGIHFIALDNVSDPGASLGDEQLQWLANDLATQHKRQPIVVFAHRPLFDLAPAWDWATPDGSKAIDQLMPFKNVTVFYGHIHQEHHYMTAHIPHHSAKGLMFPLPPPMSVPKKAPIPWDASAPYKGLGFREIEADNGAFSIEELTITAQVSP